MVKIPYSLLLLVGSGPATENLSRVENIFLFGEGWKVSTPAEQVLDVMPLAEHWSNAAELERFFGL